MNILMTISTPIRGKKLHPVYSWLLLKFNSNNTVLYRKVVLATTVIQAMGVRNHLVSNKGIQIQELGNKKTTNISWETETLDICINKASSFIHRALCTND